MPRGPKGERRPADVIRNTVHVMRSTPEEGKDPAAVALGRKGGKARAEGVCPPSGGKRLPERRQRPVGNRPAGIVEALAVAPFPAPCVKPRSRRHVSRWLCQGVKQSRPISIARLWWPRGQALRRSGR